MTLPIHDGDIELLIAVMRGKTMTDLGREAGCTSQNICRKVRRVKSRIGWKPSMTEDQVREIAKSLQLVRASCTPSALQELMTERDQLKAENEALKSQGGRLFELGADLGTELARVKAERDQLRATISAERSLAAVLEQNCADLAAELERVRVQA